MFIIIINDAEVSASFNAVSFLTLGYFTLLHYDAHDELQISLLHEQLRP